MYVPSKIKRIINIYYIYKLYNVDFFFVIIQFLTLELLQNVSPIYLYICCFCIRFVKNV